MHEIKRLNSKHIYLICLQESANLVLHFGGNVNVTAFHNGTGLALLHEWNVNDMKGENPKEIHAET